MDFASEFIVEDYDYVESVAQFEELYLHKNEDEESKCSQLQQNYSHDYEGDSDSDSDFGVYESCIMDFDDEEMDEKQEPPSLANLPKQASSNTVKCAMRNMIQEPADQTLHISRKVQCKAEDCKVVLSHIDKPLQGQENQIWKCQFCGYRQVVADWPQLSEDMKDVLYLDSDVDDNDPLLLEKIPPLDTIVIFVIDTSGSMSLQVKGAEGVTKLKFDTLSPVLIEVIQQEQLKTVLHQPRSKSKPLAIASYPELVSDITRLQTVKAGLIEQLRQMPEEQRVGLISFNSEVVIHGDCSSPPFIIPRDECNTLEFDQLFEMCENLGSFGPLGQTRAGMEKVIMDLEDDGQTALGPALSVAVAMASEVKGSKVIVCTDGVANFGIGRTSSLPAHIKAFYDSIVQKCQMNGVSISVISFDDCGMPERFGGIPNETGGQVEKVSCAHARFQEALEREICNLTYATNVTLRFSVHKDMYIPDVKRNEKKSTVEKDLGNISLKTQQCFKFAFRQPNPSPHNRGGASQSQNGGFQGQNGAPEGHNTGPQGQYRPPLKMLTQGEQGQTGVNLGGEETEAVEGGSSEPEKTEPTKLDTENSQSPTLQENCGSKDVEPEGTNGSKKQIPDLNLDKGNREATPFTEPATAKVEPGYNKQEEKEEEKDVEEKQSPFQFEVSFKTMSGVSGTRVWTSLKPVTTSVEKAEKSANPGIVVDNFLQQTAIKIIGLKDPSKLNWWCQLAIQRCEQHKQIYCCDDETLLSTLNNFKKTLKTICHRGKIDEDTATELRKRENSQT